MVGALHLPPVSLTCSSSCLLFAGLLTTLTGSFTSLVLGGLSLTALPVLNLSWRLCFPSPVLISIVGSTWDLSQWPGSSQPCFLLTDLWMSAGHRSSDEWTREFLGSHFLPLPKQ